MDYRYICECGKKKNVECPMGLAPKEIPCDCGGIMRQDFLGKLKSIQTDLPEDYKALSEFHSVDYGDDDVMERSLNGDF